MHLRMLRKWYPLSTRILSPRNKIKNKADKDQNVAFVTVKGGKWGLN